MRSSSALWAGHLDESEQWAREVIRLAAAAGLAGEQRAARWRVGLVLACRGHLEEVAAIAQEQLAAANVNIVADLHGRALLGYDAGMRGVAADTIVHLQRVLAILDELACREPGQFRWITEYYVEALIAVGRIADARSVTEDYERYARAAQRRSALAAVARCRCLLLAEAGDVNAALDAADEALRWHADLDRPVERARTLLIKGQVHRRFRQSGAARQTLTDALAEFERIGMTGLAERARSELARVSLRRAAATLELTETERRVAELTAQGLTAAQTAAALFVSPKTVSANLTKVYRKLGVSNRVELTARLAARE
jgi:DNA-binding CsgD family transcriptional regulator